MRVVPPPCVWRDQVYVYQTLVNSVRARGARYVFPSWQLHLSNSTLLNIRRK